MPGLLLEGRAAVIRISPLSTSPAITGFSHLTSSMPLEPSTALRVSTASLSGMFSLVAMSRSARGTVVLA